jgi:hypothetical protein
MTSGIPAPHAYLSALRDLTSADGEENLRRKREQQAALAESLKNQIEAKAKRNAKAAVQSRFTFSEKDHPPPPAKNITSAITVTTDVPAARPKPSRKQILSKADLTQFDRLAKNVYAARAIPISTDSPFLNSKMPTPPQGFSLRSISALEPTVPRFQNVERKPPADAKPKARRPPRSKSTVKCPDVGGTSKLEAESELIYPDGHSSPVNSPRNE